MHVHPQNELRCLTNVQSNYEQIDIDPASVDGTVDGADGRTGNGQGHSRSGRDLHLDSGSHRRQRPSVPELQHLVTSLQLELKESQATQMRTR